MLNENQVVGRYRIGTPLGHGGFATVYRAVHEALGSHHAVKVLKPELVEIEEIRLRFLDEARIQGRLSHPNIVRVTDILALPGVAAIVMDLVAGEPLERWIASRRTPASPTEVRQIILPLLDALGYAHANGIVHRDLKPDNILLAKGIGGEHIPRVLDFGIAQVRGDIGSRPNKRSTMANRHMGTSGYMSPEQIRSAKDVDGRSDIFVLGVILLEMTTLKHPFERASQFDTMQAVVNGDYMIPQDLWDRDPAIASAIRVALQTKPADRFDNCARFAHAIGRVAAPVGARPSRAAAPKPAPAAVSQPLEPAPPRAARTGAPRSNASPPKSMPQTVGGEDRPRASHVATDGGDSRGPAGGGRRFQVIVACSVLSVLLGSPLLIWWNLASGRPELPTPPAPTSEGADAPEPPAVQPPETTIAGPSSAGDPVPRSPSRATKKETGKKDVPEIRVEDVQAPSPQNGAPTSGPSDSITPPKRGTRYNSTDPDPVFRNFDNASMALEAGDYATAHRLFSQAIEMRSGAEALYGRGYASERLGHPVAAAADYCQALQWQPSAEMRSAIKKRLRELQQTCR
jgi:serine/threonine protein kinase